jgi:solute carrier family 25, member 34/35
MAREMLYSGPRAGFYCTVRDHIVVLFSVQNDSNSLACKIIAGLITGTAGSIIANPVDVIKVRMMADSARYTSASSAFLTVFLTEGLRGLYKGLVASTLRGAFIGAGELSAYDHSKYVLRKYAEFDEGHYLHIAASLMTGIVAATVASPFDVIKTR